MRSSYKGVYIPLLFCLLVYAVFCIPVDNAASAEADTAQIRQPLQTYLYLLAYFSADPDSWQQLQTENPHLASQVERLIRPLCIVGPGVCGYGKISLPGHSNAPKEQNAFIIELNPEPQCGAFSVIERWVVHLSSTNELTIKLKDHSFAGCMSFCDRKEIHQAEDEAFDCVVSHLPLTPERGAYLMQEAVSRSKPHVATYLHENDGIPYQNKP